MPEIKCPNCGKVFTVDESGYQEIVKQVRDELFSKELNKRSELLKSQLDAENENKLLETKNESASKQSELEKTIQDLQNKLSNTEQAKQLAISQSLEEKNKLIAERENEIIRLKGEIQSQNSKSELELTKAVQDKESEITKLRTSLTLAEKEAALKEKSIQEQYQSELKGKDEQIAFYKDLKTRMSTKLLGETLEQHCLIEFNRIRMTAFPTAYFEKDNDSSISGSKGDFIFRENTSEGAELISIMFEMKNEADTTATKHKNEDFFKELDKDRREKGCEYAVLVSMLEPENELYNNGIVDVSYRYPKMYVIRPQCFISMITLLRNASLNAAQYKNELNIARNQSVDVTNFEASLLDFQQKFGRNYNLAKDKFAKAIDEIDKSIANLTKVKESLIGADKNLSLANDKAQDLSIKKLTRNNPTMKEKFDELHKNKKEGTDEN